MRRTRCWLVLVFAAVALLLVLAPSLAADSQKKAIRFGKLVDGTGKVTNDALVMVDGDRIVSVTTGGTTVPDDAELIDLREYTGIPGLIDVHTHMTYYWDQTPGTTPWSQHLGGRLPAVTVFLSQENAQRALETGVTTVRDLGASEYTDIAMRDLINRGAMSGPRMFVSGHGLFINYLSARPSGDAVHAAVAAGVPDVMRVVRQEIFGAGADVVKMYASTGSAADLEGRQTFTFEEIKAAVDAAHNLGVKIAVHSYGPDGARDAVRAGADSIEHATDLDDETIAEMARRGTFYVPTIDHNRYYADHADEYGYGPEVVERLNDFIERNLETARRAREAGVRFAMGSDAVFTMFGQNTRELAWFVKAGMTPEQALATATSNAAVLLGMEEDLGAVAPGYHADIVAVEGDPLSDINVVIENVRWVMKDGAVVFDGPGERQETATPEHPE
jgi:imidazolonepropionase-like amidohydrolase